jgi:hypothetical protein
MPITNVRTVKFKTTINKSGKTVDWVLYGNAESLQTSLTWARVKDLMPPEDFDDDRDKQGVKMMHMRAVWSQIEPRYQAWKSGSQMPETGTPLTAWPGLNEAEIEAFNRAGIRSVEDVAEMGDGLLSKVQLPGVREHRAQARKFLEMADKAHALDRIAELEAKLAELAAAQEAPKRGPGRPRKAEAQAEGEAA